VLHLCIKISIVRYTIRALGPKLTEARFEQLTQGRYVIVKRPAVEPVTHDAVTIRPTMPPVCLPCVCVAATDAFRLWQQFAYKPAPHWSCFVVNSTLWRVHYFQTGRSEVFWASKKICPRPRPTHTLVKYWYVFTGQRQHGESPARESSGTKVQVYLSALETLCFVLTFTWHLGHLLRHCPERNYRSKNSK